tara:strand:- start:3680 stop:4471 length:792 start_codon:yes stop_codon:yes gene_type:complete
MSRLFTFGCSFTYYSWPTWANIVAIDKQTPFYNFGMAGLGNVGIHQRVLEADLKYNFTSEDKIMIMWTSYSRNDQVLGYDYEAAGSVFNKKRHSTWYKLNWSRSNDIIKNSNAIIYTNKAYNVNWQMAAFDHTFVETGEFSVDSDVSDNNFANSLQTMFNKKLPELKKISFKEAGNRSSFDIVADSHPDVNDHLNILLDSGYRLKPKTIEVTKNLYNDIKNKLTNDHITDFDQATSTIATIIEKDYFDTFYKYQSYESLGKGI